MEKSQFISEAVQINYFWFRPNNKTIDVTYYSENFDKKQLYFANKSLPVGNFSQVCGKLITQIANDNMEHITNKDWN